MAKRTRSELEKLMKENNCSVIISGNNGEPRVVSRPEDLPSEVDLAGDDIVRKQQALGDIQKQIDALLKVQREAEEATMKVAQAKEANDAAKAEQGEDNSDPGTGNGADAPGKPQK